MKPTFFPSAAALRRWLHAHHATAAELWVGFYRKASRKNGILYRDALDEALCFGWIDDVRKRLDDEAYVQRFSPRKPKSYWSQVNTARAEALIRQGRMAPAGKRAFESRDTRETARRSVERAAARFDAGQERRFRREISAWTFFQSQPPSYRKVCTFWVVSARKEETRTRRLDTLIAACAAGRKIDLLAPNRTT